VDSIHIYIDVVRTVRKNNMITYRVYSEDIGRYPLAVEGDSPKLIGFIIINSFYILYTKNIFKYEINGGKMLRSQNIHNNFA